jgi:cullin 3
MASTYTLGLHLFLENFIRNKAIPIKSNVLNVSLALIRIERDGEIVTRGLLKTLTDMMCELREVSSEGKQSEGESIYKSWWEELFLDATRRYYENESEVNLETCSAPECLLRIEKRLQEESDRVDTYLHPSTHPLLFSLLEQVLISDAIQPLIAHPSSGLSTLLAENKVPDLSRMYSLFGKTGEGHLLLTRAIKAWIVELGSKFAETAMSGAKSASGAGGDGGDDEEGAAAASATGAKTSAKGKGKAKEGADGASAAAAPKAGTAAAANNIAIEWVAAVLAFKDKMDNLWVLAFEKDRAFQTAINDVRPTQTSQLTCN